MSKLLTFEVEIAVGHVKGATAHATEIEDEYTRIFSEWEVYRDAIALFAFNSGKYESTLRLLYRTEDYNEREFQNKLNDVFVKANNGRGPSWHFLGWPCWVKSVQQSTAESLR